MNQLSIFPIKLWEISEITRYIRALLDSDPNLQDIWVQGEVSNIKLAPSGHLYFTVKDISSALRCVMWRPLVKQQQYLPDTGEAVEVHGSISIYETAGQYQLYADIIRPVGEGILYQEFLRLKAKLEAEGLFDPGRKRSIPQQPQKLGIVTSPTGAALHDIVNTIKRRYPLVEIFLSPTLVQGNEAPKQIISALDALNRIIKPDVILLARGGGSIEDLWAFNDEEVARAIARSEVPVITGVGHETDFTIADFVSDLRAPTPTAAAELATPNRFELEIGLSEIEQTLTRSISSRLSDSIFQVNQHEYALNLLSPEVLLRTERQKLDENFLRFQRALNNRLQLGQAKLQGLEQQLTSLNPYSILDRGYSAVTFPDGRAVHSIKQVKPKDRVNVRTKDGAYAAEVQDILDEF